MRSSEAANTLFHFQRLMGTMPEPHRHNSWDHRHAHLSELEQKKLIVEGVRGLSTNSCFFTDDRGKMLIAYAAQLEQELAANG
jgi:hypothetical protein